MPPFLPQATLRAPVNETPKQLQLLGDTLGKALEQRRDMKAKQEIGQAFQQGGIPAAQQVAFRAGRPDLGMQFANLIEQQEARAAQQALQQQRLGIAQSQLELARKAAEAGKPGTFKADDFGRLYDSRSGQYVGGGGAPEVPNAKRLEAQFGKPQAGYRWTETGNLEAIPGGGATKLPAESAGKMAMLRSAGKDLPSARAVLTRPWTVGEYGQSMANAGDVGRAQRTVKAVIESALRVMTGAAAPETEVARYEDLFMPKPYDTAETANQKLDMLEAFAQQAEQTMNQGRGGANASQTNNDPLGIR